MVRVKVEFAKNSFRVCVGETEAETDFQTAVRAHLNGKKLILKD